MIKKLKAGVIGATGYAGEELVRLLANHPFAETAAVSSVSFEGQKLSDVYPALRGFCALTLTTADEVIETADVIFTALPHGLSEEIAAKAKGKPVIDFGADFRLDDEATYKKWYGKDFAYPELHKNAVYCIPELNRGAVGNADIIAAPGCYPTAAALGLAPVIKKRLVRYDGIVIDAKSGVTGAGRGLTQNTHFPDANEGFSAYKAGAHRHTPEIEQTVSKLAGEKITLTFVPHLLPVNRGIEESIYCRLDDGADMEKIRAAYESEYGSERFVRLMPEGEYANIHNVRMSNFCDISLHLDAHTRTLIICSCIDNIVKGAAGQAMQLMNIRMGFPEESGLLLAPPAI